MSIEPARLIFVRHGEPDEEMLGRCYGSLDVRLSDRGREQSRRLAQALATSRAGAVFSSPLIRASETARAIAVTLHVEVQIRPNLSEIDFGDIEGRSFEEIAANAPELYARWMAEPETVTFPGGENFRALSARVRAEVGRIRAERQSAVSIVVSHGGAIRAILADVLELKPSMAFRVQVGWASLTVIDWYKDAAVVKLVNGRAANSALGLAEP